MQTIAHAGWNSLHSNSLIANMGDQAQENVNAATSEVGSALPTNITDAYLAALQVQNNNLMEIIKNMQTPKASATDEKGKHIILPKFHPEGAGADASAWCTTVDLIFADKMPEGSSLMITLSKALEGSASQWLSQICFAGITWPQFKELFVQRFVGIETSAATLMKILNGRPKSGESYTEYGSRIVTLLMSKFKSIDLEEMAVSLTLAHMAQIDDKLSRWVFTNNIKTRNDMQQQLQAHTFKKRNLDDDASTTGPERKKPKYLSQVKCNYCGKTGHKYAECRARQRSQNQGRSHNGSSTQGSKDRSTVKCFKCDELGHFASACPKGRSRGNNQVTEKRVDICTVAPPSGIVRSSTGESVPFCFDSGAECSLVKESDADKFSGKRINNIVKLNGICNDSICSTQQLLCNINIDQCYFEILLHVIMDKYLKYDVLIGREILGQGFGVTMDADKFQIYTTKRVESLVTINYEEVIETNHELDDLDKTALKKILKCFSDWFIDGIPKTRVTTGQLEIRLIDQQKTVQRRPYRLSEEEKSKVRGKVDELLKAKIIRPSCSPFASPMMLVKKRMAPIDCVWTIAC